MKPRELSHDHSEFSKPKNRQIHQTNATCWNVEFKCSPTKRQNKSSKESLHECYSMSIYPLSFSVCTHSYIFLKFYD